MCTIDTAPEMLSSAVSVFENSRIEEFEPFVTLLINWKEKSINSFTIVRKERINNSHIESKNKILKHLMYNANGFSTD